MRKRVGVICKATTNSKFMLLGIGREQLMLSKLSTISTSTQEIC